MSLVDDEIDWIMVRFGKEETTKKRDAKNKKIKKGDMACNGLALASMDGRKNIFVPQGFVLLLCFFCSFFIFLFDTVLACCSCSCIREVFLANSERSYVTTYEG